MGNVKFMFKFFISILISIFIVSPIFFVIFGWNELRRILVTIYFKLTGNPAVISIGHDGIFAYSARANIRILCVFKGSCNFGNLQEMFVQKILQATNATGGFKYKKLRSKFITEAGYSCWKTDGNFNLQNHLRKLPEESVATEENLMDFIQSQDKPLPKDRPQWEVIFLPRLPNPKESGLLLVMHHSYGDGLSIINTLAEQLSPEKPFPYVFNPVTFKPPFWKQLVFMIKGYGNFGWTLVNEIRNRPKISKDRHPTEIEYVASRDARFNLSLTQLKRIQRRTNNSTVSAIFITATQNALDNINKEQFWLERGVLVAKFPYPKAELCNRFTQLNVAVVPDSKDYFSQLQEVNKSTRVESNFTYFVNDTMCGLFGRQPAGFVQKLKFTKLMIISNLPLTTRPFHLGNEIITDCYVWPILDRSIAVSSASVGDKINVAVAAGANIFSKDEFDFFVEELKAQFYLMEFQDVHAKENKVSLV